MHFLVDKTNKEPQETQTDTSRFKNKVKFLNSNHSLTRFRIPPNQNLALANNELFRKTFKSTLKEKFKNLKMSETRPKKIDRHSSLSSLLKLRQKNNHTKSHFFEARNNESTVLANSSKIQDNMRSSTDRIKYKTGSGFSFPKTDKVTIIQELINKYPNKEQDYIDLDAHYDMSKVRKPNLVYYEAPNKAMRRNVESKGVNGFDRFMRIYEMNGVGKVIRSVAEF